MATVLDVAEYLLERMGPMTTMKLQKLAYYAQAWSLVWDEAPLFDEPIEAWANGPVVPQLFQAHKGQFTVQSVGGCSAHLSEAQRESIDAVVEFYGCRTSQWLSDLTHQEEPWQKARADVPDGERGHAVMSHGALADYYSNL